ncbi:hypothetical protein HAX54_043757 [Datura stramonium]|uniref:Uncharacterized protein n=1 Tax=Datura stramonium TaxID=4076 RepID=A0ABS8W3I8_DATST|nr:hypothetical protein [Datura stramonium]
MAARQQRSEKISRRASIKGKVRNGTETRFLGYKYKWPTITTDTIEVVGSSSDRRQTEDNMSSCHCHNPMRAMEEEKCY